MVVIYLLTFLLALFIVYLANHLRVHYDLVAKFKDIPGYSQIMPFFIIRIPLLAPYGYHGNHAELTQSAMRMQKPNERLFRTVNGKTANLFITDVADLKQVYLKMTDIMPKPDFIYRGMDMFGQNILTEVDQSEWKNHHMLCSPAFSSSHMKYLAKVSVESFDLLRSACWDPNLKNKDDKYLVDMYTDMTNVTLDIIGKAGFNVDLGVMNEDSEWNKVDTSKYAYTFRHALEVSISDGILSRGLIPTPFQWMLSQTNRAISDFSNYIDELYQIKIKQFKADQEASNNNNNTSAAILEDEDRLDLMSLLLLANEDEGPFIDEEGHKTQKIKMNYSQIKSNMFIFLAAGHETTSTQLQWTLLELARHPEAFKKLQDEVDRLLPNKRAPSIDDYDSLTYTLSCIKESMRLHPPVTMVPKRPTKNVMIKGHKIPKNTLIWINIRAIHRDPEYWSDPLRYNPERFYNEELAKQIKPLTFLPFSFGIRKCIGFQFSLVESVMMLARFAQFYDVDLAQKMDPLEDLKEEPVITVRPSRQYRIRISPRRDN